MKIDRATGVVALVVIALMAACQRNRSSDASNCPFSEAGYGQQIAAARDVNELYALYRADAARCPLATAQASYSRALVLRLGQRWQDLPQLAQFAQFDPAFASFLYEHVNKGADAPNLKALLKTARTQCPTTIGEVCEQLAWRAQAALIAQGVTN